VPAGGAPFPRYAEALGRLQELLTHAPAGTRLPPEMMRLVFTGTTRRAG